MRIEGENLDLKVCVAFSALLVMAITAFPGSPIRILLGLPFVLFIPGYVLVSVLFPRKVDLEGIERIALSFGLSIAIVPLLGLGLNYTPFGIGLNPILISLLVFILVMSYGGYVRRANISPQERFSITVKIPKIEFSAYSSKEKALYAVLALSLVASMIILYDYATKPKIGEKYTEFFILNENMKAEDYPTDLRLGEEDKVVVGVVNNEYTKVNYTIIVNLENETLEELNFVLRHGENMRKLFVFRPNKIGEDLKLEFLLYKGTSTEPYKSLHLWIDVRANLT